MFSFAFDVKMHFLWNLIKAKADMRLGRIIMNIIDGCEIKISLIPRKLSLSHILSYLFLL